MILFSIGRDCGFQSGFTLKGLSGGQKQRLADEVMRDLLTADVGMLVVIHLMTIIDLRMGHLSSKNILQFVKVKKLQSDLSYESN